MNRSDVLKRIKRDPRFDIIIIGGGATGIGSALEGCLRGYQTLLLEKGDFTCGTSSRSTKLVHGGVRYLEQGNILLVLEALRERGYLRNNAPHIVKDQLFIIPNYKWWEGPFYTVGLKFYDILSGFLSFGKSMHISRKKISELIPGIIIRGLKGGVIYHDGQFDDCRLAMDLLHTVFEKGGYGINYFPVRNILKDSKGNISGVEGEDITSGKRYKLFSPAIINATGVWADEILKMDQPETPRLIRPSQGIHLVLDKKFLPGKSALMIPKTDDGRVLFAIPWHNHVVIGTTDTPLDHAMEEPQALDEEIDFILNNAGRYLSIAPQRKDILSVFAGLRPLAAPKNNTSKTKEISRSHRIFVSRSKLITIAGGKWTTYRKMAEDTIDKAERVCNFPHVRSLSKRYRISGCIDNFTGTDHLSIYGTRKENILTLITEDGTLAENIHPDLDYIKAEILWCCRSEMVIKLEDILARRIRALFLNARAAVEIAPEVAEIAAKELGWNNKKKQDEIESFIKLARNYIA